MPSSQGRRKPPRAGLWLRREAQGALQSAPRRSPASEAFASTAILLHLAFDASLDRAGGGRVTASDLAECRASLFVIAEHGERFAEPKHSLRRARGFGVVGRELQILFGSLARARALEVAFAEIECRVGDKAVAGIMR